MLSRDIKERVEQTEEFGRLRENYRNRVVTELNALCGSAFSLYAATLVEREGGVHVFVCNDRDSAAYLCNDFYKLLGEEGVMFFPTGWKRSIRYGKDDASGTVQRTAVLKALREEMTRLAVFTYPEALSETVVDAESFAKDSLCVSRGDVIEMAQLEEMVQELGFRKVDFVCEPGQYSIRGGIFDVFSYTQNKPCRLDFFGNEVESVRLFEIASQLSVEKIEKIDIVPDFKGRAEDRRVPFMEFAATAAYWFEDMSVILGQIDSLRKKFLAECEDPTREKDKVISALKLTDALEGRAVFTRNESEKMPVSDVIRFRTQPQPSFNKQYQILAQDLRDHILGGYQNFLLTENKAQSERLKNLIDATGVDDARFTTLDMTLHEGFVDASLRMCFYTDHQIFDRYHRYSLKGEIDKGQMMTVAELNQMQVGDFVVHIDHGVGRFGGLVSTVENGKRQESVKLVYKDGDVLFVNVHSLHRISRYKSKDTEELPRVAKLGTGAWQRMKEATKKAVKEIARELVRLYAERKASGGFRFSPDNYLQQEMESSFQYEETPDQQKAIELIKSDMESAEPMDRLVCGDVGFGKTEVAVRAAFKAVCDSKQVAVLVPTTILALQHYRTFSERLSGLPARVEMLSRVKTAKEVRQIAADLEAGKIDILIGTHKILGKDIKFRDLGLLIIDEEQKFGVSSKEKLRKLSVSVDTLTLTATPIPRTLQFSLMGARDLSIIATPPPNRQPIVTESHVFNEEIIHDAVEYELMRGGQVYFVHNRVDNIEQVADMIRRLVPQAKVVVGHGQMPPATLEKLIMDFIYGEFDVFVSTTIIENGIDIANANTIIINDAQNFGLSDLHQLRGRVGRSDKKGFCFLLSPPDEMLSGDARRRLRAIEEFSDLGSGFNIAMQDLDIRGAGNLLGAEQSGFIADMGFETYQKILNEAVAELRAEGLGGLDDVSPVNKEEQIEVNYITDCQIETDLEALLPDDYVGQSGEKLNLYRQLDNMDNEQDLQRLAAEMKDRFGTLPQQAQNLFDVVRLRWRCIRLGFEAAKVKNGLMLLKFPANNNSAYYKSPVFKAVMIYAGDRKEKFVLKQNNNRLGLTVRNIGSMESAWKTLDEIIGTL